MFKHVLIHLICWKTTGNAGNELEHQRWTRNEMQDGTDRVRGSTGSTGKLRVECKDSKPKQWMVRIDGWKFSWNIRSLFQGHQSLWSWCFCGHQSTAQLVPMQHRTQTNKTKDDLQSLTALPSYMRSNLWSMREKTSAIAVELEIMQHARMTLAKSPPGTTVGGW